MTTRLRLKKSPSVSSPSPPGGCQHLSSGSPAAPWVRSLLHTPPGSPDSELQKNYLCGSILAPVFICIWCSEKVGFEIGSTPCISKLLAPMCSDNLSSHKKATSTCLHFASLQGGHLRNAEPLRLAPKGSSGLRGLTQPPFPPAFHVSCFL